MESYLPPLPDSSIENDPYLTRTATIRKRPSLPVPPTQPTYYSPPYPHGRKPLPTIPLPTPNSAPQTRRVPLSSPPPPPPAFTTGNSYLQRVNSMAKGKGPANDMKEYDFEEFRFLTLLDEEEPRSGDLLTAVTTASPTTRKRNSLPGYQHQDRDPDEREGLTKDRRASVIGSSGLSSGVTATSFGAVTAIESEKRRLELESVRRAQSDAIEQLIKGDSKMDEAERRRREVEGELGVIGGVGGSGPDSGLLPLGDKRLEGEVMSGRETPPPPMSPISDPGTADRRVDLFPLGDKPPLIASTSPSLPSSSSSAPSPPWMSNKNSPPSFRRSFSQSPSTAEFLFTVPESEDVPSYEPPAPAPVQVEYELETTNHTLQPIAETTLAPPPLSQGSPSVSNPLPPVRHQSASGRWPPPPPPPLPPKSLPASLPVASDTTLPQERVKHGAVAPAANLSRGKSFSTGFYAGGVSLALAKDTARFDSAANIPITESPDEISPTPPPSDLTPPNLNPSGLPLPFEFTNTPSSNFNPPPRVSSLANQSYPLPRTSQPPAPFLPSGLPRPPSGAIIMAASTPPQWQPSFLVPAAITNFAQVTETGQRIAFYGPPPPGMNLGSSHVPGIPTAGYAATVGSTAPQSAPGYFSIRPAGQRSSGVQVANALAPGGSTETFVERNPSPLRASTGSLPAPPPPHAGYASYPTSQGAQVFPRASYESRPVSSMSAPAPSRSPNVSRGSSHRETPSRGATGEGDPVVKHSLWGWT